MPQSKRYKAYQKRFYELRKNLLPAKFSSTGTYSSRVEDRARAFYVLVHGEIEAYFEDVAINAIQQKVALWKNSKVVSHLLFSFISSYHTGWKTEEIDVTAYMTSPKKAPKDCAIEAVDYANTIYTASIIKKNHGVKSENLKSVFVPLGVDFTLVDSTWLIMMDDFGTKRGDIAHNTKAVHNVIDPENVFNELKIINEGIIEFDKIFSDVQKS